MASANMDEWFKIKFGFFTKYTNSENLNKSKSAARLRKLGLFPFNLLFALLFSSKNDFVHE